MEKPARTVGTRDSICNLVSLPHDGFMEVPLAPEDLMQWYTIQSQKKHEHIAARRLQELEGVEVLCPRIRFERLSRHGNTGKVWVTEALFPGYLFARFHYAQQHRAIRYAPGVSTIVHFGDQIPTIPEALIADLRRLGGEERTLAPVIEIGGNVTLVSGVWKGMEAVVTGFVEAKQRVKILIELLGGLVETEIGYDQFVVPAAHPWEAQSK